MHAEKKHITVLYFLVDIALIAVSLYVPYSMRYSDRLFAGGLPYMRDTVFLFMIWSAALVALLKARGLYSTDRSLSLPGEAWKVLVCVLSTSLLAGLVIFLMQLRFFSRLVFVQNIVLLFLSLSLWRLVKRLFIRHRLARGFYNRNVLVVGAGMVGKALVAEIDNHPHLGLNVVGFFDDHRTGTVAGHPVFTGGEGAFKDILQKNFIDEVYITIPSQRKLVSGMISVCRAMEKAVCVIADNFTLPFYRLELGHLGLMPVIRYLGTKQHGTELYVKRVLDVIIAGTALVVLSPLFAALALWIKLDSPGPVFYKSLRSGRKGRIFTFYKFRSMVDGADAQRTALRAHSDVSGPIFKMKRDPRVTRAGRVLRQWSLDELPQLVNVLKGDMSLVGPRPPVPEEVEEYDAWQMRRLEVRPGLTCLWQVRGRSDLSFYKWVKWDLWYIDNWSFGLDIMILLWTVPVVLKRKGAY